MEDGGGGGGGVPFPHVGIEPASVFHLAFQPSHNQLSYLVPTSVPDR